jgi:hypothetical protein
MGGIIMATINSNGTMVFGNTSGGSVTIAPVNNTSANYTLTIPNVSGTVAFVDSQAFTGTPTAPTAPAGTNTSQIATTAFVTTADNLKAPLSNPSFTGQVFIPEGTASSPGLTFQNDGAPDTGLYHISDGSFGATCNTIPVASFTNSGVSLLKTPSAPTAAPGTNTTQLATTAMVHSAITNDLNVTGPAPMYACRAWANFNGTNTVAIRASGNVSSITKNGTGDYTINFTTAMQDASYSAAIHHHSGTAGNAFCITGNAAPTTTTYRFASVTTSAAGIDTTYVSASFFR